MLALGADEIIIGSHSYIGKIDPQLGGLKSEALINYINLDEKYISSENIYKVKEAENIFNYMDEILMILFKNHPKQDKYEKIKEQFIFSRLPHCKLFDYSQCKNIGFACS